MTETKSYQISKALVYQAWKQVKKNKGAAGYDGISIEKFEEGLEDNLYKIWNRMSSGSYFPPVVLLCDIPKSDGKVRTLGIPTVADRVAQMVVKIILEPQIDPQFHQDSYGYRPKKSARQAVGVARQRCWQMNWVIDLDIKGFFDSINHELMMRAMRKHTEEKWMLLYIERWLKASAQGKDGTQKDRTEGTPQGGVISPLLANIFLHHAYDSWMQAQFSDLPFERYADDILVHCWTEKQAQYVLEQIRQRLKRCGLELHPTKTKIVYCKDGQRKGKSKHEKFDFLGYEFRARKTRNSQRGNYFVGFNPAISPKAKQAIRRKIRSWQLTKRTPMSLEEVAAWINPQVRGWINYYGVYCKSALQAILEMVDYQIASWAMRKYKGLHRKLVRALRWLRTIYRRNPYLFAHRT
jgi:RNA-directed DNA polymerase